MCNPAAAAMAVMAVVSIGTTIHTTKEQNKYQQEVYALQQQQYAQEQANAEATAYAQAEAATRAQEADNAALDYQAQIALNNAQSAEWDAAHAKETAADEAAQHMDDVRRFLGTQRAAQSASGAVVDSGTFLDVTLDTVGQGKLDEMAILYEGDLEAWRHETTATNYRAEAGLYESQKIDPFLAGQSAFYGSYQAPQGVGAAPYESSAVMAGTQAGIGYAGSAFSVGAAGSTSTASSTTTTSGVPTTNVQPYSNAAKNPTWLK